MKAFTDQLDDCTYKGRFSNLDAVPDVCNAAFFGASDVLAGRPEDGLLTLLRHGCAKWRASPMTENNRRDCEDVGRGYWHLKEAVNRAALANVNPGERRKTMSLADASNQYVASVNPMEVSEQAEFLQELNAELEKPQINPGVAFMAGMLEAEFESWMLHHCPTELVWGLAAKEYATALSACSALEPELRRFENNMLRVVDSYPTNKTRLK